MNDHQVETVEEFPGLESQFSKPVDSTGKELKYLLEEFFSAASLKQKTVLTKEQIAQLIRAIVYADKFKSEIMTNFVTDFMELALSQGAMKHKDMVRVLMSRMSAQGQMENRQRSWMQRLMGGGNRGLI